MEKINVWLVNIFSQLISKDKTVQLILCGVENMNLHGLGLALADVNENASFTLI